MVVDYESYNKLMKGKALRKHSLHEKTAASVLLKLFITQMRDGEIFTSLILRQLTIPNKVSSVC